MTTIWRGLTLREMIRTRERIGIAVANADGNLTWVGTSEQNVTIPIYADERQARRRLRDIYCANHEIDGSAEPLRLVRVRVTVEEIGPLVAPERRERHTPPLSNQETP